MQITSWNRKFITLLSQLPFYFSFCCLGIFLFTACDTKNLTPTTNATSSSISIPNTTQQTSTTVSITLLKAKNVPLVGVTPVYSVTPSTGVSLGSCSATNSFGESTCTFATSVATTYTPSVTSPISVSGSSFTVYQKPSSLSFTTQPTGVASNANISPAIAVQVLDPSSAAVTNTASTLTMTLTLSGSDSSAVLSQGGTACASTGCTATVSAGTATFSTISINKVGVYTLTASVSGITQTSNSFAVGTNNASQLVFATQPSTTAVTNRQISQAPILNIRDAGNNTVTTGSDANVDVTLSLTNCAGATLIGADTQTATSGVATFLNNGIRIDSPGAVAGCTLQADATLGSGATSTTSTTFDLSAPGAASRLTFGNPTSNSSDSKNKILDQQPIVYITDASGNVVTSDYSTSVTLGLSASSSGGGTLTGTTTGTASAGVVAFTDIAIDQAGTYYITAQSGTLTPTVSTKYTISTPGTAAALQIYQQPIDSRTSTTLARNIIVRVVDSSGNVVTSNTDNIVATLASGTGALGGVTTVAAVSGVATFSGMNINAVGTKTITFSDGALTTATTNSFNIYNLGSARKLVFTQQPTTVNTVTVAFPTQPIVAIKDEHDFTITTDNATNITIACVYPAGCALAATGVLTKSVTAGVADFTGEGISITVPAATDTIVLEATDGGALYAPARTNPNLKTN